MSKWPEEYELPPIGTNKPAATGSGEPKPNNGLSFQEYEQWTPEKSVEVTLSRETLRRLYEHARHEIGCPHLNENLTSNTDCNCDWYEIETEVLATLRVSTPPASQPTVTLDRKKYDRALYILQVVADVQPHSDASAALALLRAAEQKS